MHLVGPPPGDLLGPAQPLEDPVLGVGDDDGVVGRVAEEELQPLVPLAGRLLGPLAAGDVVEQHGHAPQRRVAGAEGEHRPPPAERRRVLLEPGRLARQRHPAVQVEPVPVLVRGDLPHPPPGGVRDARLRLERRADLEEAVVDGPPVLVERHLQRAEALLDRVEQLEVARLGVPPPLLGPRPRGQQVADLRTGGGGTAGPPGRRSAGTASAPAARPASRSPTRGTTPGGLPPPRGPGRPAARPTRRAGRRGPPRGGPRRPRATASSVRRTTPAPAASSRHTASTSAHAAPASPAPASSVARPLGVLRRRHQDEHPLVGDSLRRGHPLPALPSRPAGRRSSRSPPRTAARRS